ncbi:trehalose-phosphatase [Corynebacterium epidermidicanis]|uniref:Trehalose 6-phosphate phosphatase n=1 Tax=Corynebacterium epidermidicanis TaxID=1050174 RepID=A0A0G3GTS3_9CORY|nr:trehalose-phosphatase [Corynebacterium epidermidicanis]AKK03950.1 trehalose-phosphatase [Corynebacterium epidermidicanis]
MDFASAADVTSALVRVADVPRLLVISDFDGTLADFSVDPYNVPVNQKSIAMLQELGTLPNTFVAILSGRHREGLAQVSGAPEGIVLAGSHGADAHVLSDSEATALEEVAVQLEKLVESVSGAFVERKPFNCVLHYRDVSEDLQQQLIAGANDIAVPGAHQIPGKFVIEFSVVDITKGTWITEARERYEADAVVFFGDDVTDEHGFRALGPADLGIRVSEGPTAAHIRIPDTAAVAATLEELYQLRADATVEPA